VCVCTRALLHSVHLHQQQRQTAGQPFTFNASWFIWTFLMAYFKAKLEAEWH